MFKLLDVAQNITDTYASPMLADYPLVGNFRVVGACVILYLYMCVMGPRYMKDRKEFHVYPFMQAYNIFMVVLNAWVLYELTVTSVNRNWFCEPHSVERTPFNMRHAFAIWVYFVSKIVEFLDTFFFIVRKKFSQLSFLHVYHHSTMSISIWMIVTFCPAGDAFFPVYCNASVHVVMYSYYFIAALGPEYQKYIWWKRHLTKFQITQFFSIMSQGASSIYVNCNPSYNGYHWYILAYMSSFVFLFSQFYMWKYLRGRNTPAPAVGTAAAKPIKTE